MAQPTDFKGNHLSKTFTQKSIDAGAILYTLGDNPREQSTELLKNMGIHPDYMDAAKKGEPFGATVIDLAEYRWMRKFDDL